MKNLLLIISAAILLTLLNCPELNAQCQIRCKTKVLQLGTGWDHATGIMYPWGTNDEYWRIVQAPTPYAGQLPAGIYSYKCLFEDGSNHFGKLTINR